MPPTESNTFALPQDYTFTPGGLLIHKAAFERLEKLVNQANNRDPDRHDMYIYNDFYGYAILDLVDKTLSAIHSLYQKKQWLDTWRALDALSKFNEMCYSWYEVDDGDRVRATEQAFGALLINTIRKLDAAGQLNEETIPDLELSLMQMARSGEAMADDLDACYHVVIKGYGKKLFSARTNEERERHKEACNKAFETFVKSLSAKEREGKGYAIGGQNKDADDDDEEDEDDEEEKSADKSKIWYGDAKAKDADMKDSSFQVAGVWKEYKTHLAGCPRAPLRGPANWDLTKWSAADKQRFSFGNDPMDFLDDMDDY